VVAWSGEPQARAPGEVLNFGTNVETVADGFLVDGTRCFNQRDRRAVGNTPGSLRAGGIRHASGSADSQLMLACDLSDPL
jgi:hypothetical protein